MWFEISQDTVEFDYFISIQFNKSGQNAITRDTKIAKFLNLDHEDYVYILQKHGAEQDIFFNDECYFKRKWDAKRCVEELEPYLIMKKLVGE